MIIPIIVLFVVSQIDDDLDPRAMQLIQKIDDTSKSQSYLLLNGIFAAANENPIEVGKQLLDDYNNSLQDQSYQIVEYDKNKKLALPNGEFFCKIAEEQCIETLFKTPITINDIYPSHQVLLERLNKFHKLGDFKTLTKPLLTEPTPEYSYLLKAERLKSLVAISAHQQGESEHAISMLFNQFTTVRKSLATQDTWVGKLMFLMVLSDVIDITSVIITQEKLNGSLITQLTPAETSFEIIAAREFSMGYYVYKELDKSPDFFQIGGDTPEWFVRMIYKPNMTINATLPTYLRLERLATLSPSEFTAETKKLRNPPKTSAFRNYVGSVLLNVASPDLDTYVARTFDLNAKIKLFNQLHFLKKNPNEIMSPFDGITTPTLLDNMLCFDAPLEDEKLIRCLRTRLDIVNKETL